MSRTVLFTFENDSDRDEFLSSVAGVESELVKKTLNTIKLDPAVKEAHERYGALFVGGQKHHEGLISELDRIFDQECAMHKASVILKEMRNGEWHTIRSRMTRQ